MKQKKGLQGFTLVELMVVIVILGILTSIGIFAFQSSQKKSRDSRRKSELSQVASALEMYNNDVGSYPSSTNGVIKGCNTPIIDCPWGTVFANGTLATYMVKLPVDPTSGRTYFYEKSGYGYRLYARLENLEDSSIPTIEPKVYNKNCGSSCCNFVITSPNVAEPTPQACQL